MKKYFATIFLLVCVSTLASAQSLLKEDYSYTNADTLTKHGWTVISSTVNALLVTDSSSLTYTGYAGSGVGGGVSMTNNGQDAGRLFTAPDSTGYLYVAAMINVSAAQSGGDYFFSPYSSADGYFGRTWIKSTSGGYLIGISKNSSSPTYDATVRSYGTTYLIVLRYDFNQASTTDDRVGLWVNPALDGSSPFTIPDTVGQSQNDPSHHTINTIVLRQGGATTAPSLKADGIRAGRTWNDVFYSSLVTRSSINFGSLNVGSSAVDSFYVKNTGTGSLTLGTITSSDPAIVVAPTSATIATADWQWFHVTFSPTAATASAVKLLVTPNVTTSSDTVSVSGSGVQAGFAASPTTINFGKVWKDSTQVDTVTVSNASTSASVVIDSIKSSNSFFSVTPTSATIGTSSSAKFAISFKPTAAGAASGNVVFFHNAPTHRDTIKVSGLAILKAPSFSATPSPFNFHGVLLGKSKLDSVVVKNTGYDSLFISSAASTDAAYTVTPTSARIDSQASRKFYVTFTPSALGIKSALLVFTSNVSEVKDTVAMVGSGTSVVTIAEARKDLNSDFIADHSVTLDTLAITGVVTSPNMGASASQTSYFIQDGTGGIDVFFFGLTATNYLRGDSVVVIGTVAQYRGLIEFTPLALTDTYFKVVSHVGLPTPKHVALHEFATNGENYEGQLVEIDTLIKSSGTWPASPANASVYLTNSSKIDSIQLFLDLDAQITGTAQKPYPINIVGVVSQYTTAVPPNNGYEISPRDSADIIHTLGTAGVQNQLAGIPKSYELSNSYPNPFNPSTTIEYGLPQQSKVMLKVYSVLGQEIMTLVNDVQGASYHKVQWNGRDNNGLQVSSGVYFFRIVAQPLDGKTAPFTQVRKMMLMK